MFLTIFIITYIHHYSTIENNFTTLKICSLTVHFYIITPRNRWPFLIHTCFLFFFRISYSGNNIVFHIGCFYLFMCISVFSVADHGLIAHLFLELKNTALSGQSSSFIHIFVATKWSLFEYTFSDLGVSIKKHQWWVI